MNDILITILGDDNQKVNYTYNTDTDEVQKEVTQSTTIPFGIVQAQLDTLIEQRSELDKKIQTLTQIIGLK